MAYNNGPKAHEWSSYAVKRSVVFSAESRVRSIRVWAHDRKFQAARMDSLHPIW